MYDRLRGFREQYPRTHQLSYIDLRPNFNYSGHVQRIDFSSSEWVEIYYPDCSNTIHCITPNHSTPEKQMALVEQAIQQFDIKGNYQKVPHQHEFEPEELAEIDLVPLEAQ